MIWARTPTLQFTEVPPQKANFKSRPHPQQQTGTTPASGARGLEPGLTEPGENSGPFFPSLCSHGSSVLPRFDSLTLTVALLTYVALAEW